MTTGFWARSGLLLALAAPVAALAQSAQVVMMDPLPDSNGGDPGLGQSRPSTIRVLSAADHALYLQAFAAAAKGDWAGAMAAANQGSDSAARQLLQWRYALDRNSGAKFADIDAAMKFAAAWPLKGTLQARAEAVILPDPSGANGMTPAQIIAWFKDKTPNSSIGRVRLGEALVASGRTSEGGVLIARGWADGSFDDYTENAIRTQDSAYLTADSDKARLDNLLWRGETTAARRQMTRVDAKSAAVARARILLDGGTRSARAALAAVEDSSDPALLFDWARALRAEHRDDEAHHMLLKIKPAALARDHTARWWNEVSVEARDMLRDGDAKGALDMVNHAALPTGDSYVDQQFLAGFIALRFLKDPSAALPYFQRLDVNVSRPISKSRAQYWQGRAYEALSDTASALSHYRQAAAYQDTFYGQLAAARTGANLLQVPDLAVAAAPTAEIEQDALMPQIRVLADLGQTNDLRLFVDADAKVYSSPRHLKAMMESLTQWGYPDLALRLAKTAEYAGAPILAYGYPLTPLPPYAGSDGAAPEPSLVLALIRQETEFDPYAVSSAGARGLMQVMPDTAKKSARIAKLPYRPGDLLTDTKYNMQLGMIEIAGHLQYWNGSVLLAAAGYNAGDTNTRHWVGTYGDPRTGAVDPVDFIEQIPFGETRNYVQRVLENMEVYRYRLAGKDIPLLAMRDLYAPATPPEVALSAAVKAKTN